PHSRLTVSVRCYPAHRDLHSFPTRRSSDLLMRITARSWSWLALAYLTVLLLVSLADQQHALSFMGSASLQTLVAILVGMFISLLDRKSTRLNSSHVKISYAVFCLKKKNTSY